MGDVPVEGEAVAVAKRVGEWNVRLGIAYGEVQALEEGRCEGGGVDGGAGVYGESLARDAAAAAPKGVRLFEDCGAKTRAR